jgi:hypothetical protein
MMEWNEVNFQAKYHFQTGPFLRKCDGLGIASASRTSTSLLCLPTGEPSPTVDIEEEHPLPASGQYRPKVRTANYQFKLNRFFTAVPVWPTFGNWLKTRTNIREPLTKY